jgi:hypothetical protein
VWAWRIGSVGVTECLQAAAVPSTSASAERGQRHPLPLLRLTIPVPSPELGAVFPVLASQRRRDPHRHYPPRQNAAMHLTVRRSHRQISITDGTASPDHQSDHQSHHKPHAAPRRTGTRFGGLGGFGEASLWATALVEQRQGRRQVAREDHAVEGLRLPAGRGAVGARRVARRLRRMSE